ncbi:MAG: CHAT domain-containing protein [Chloroflexi bacterium]|nr:CHAT domain-containing protein [Chloroflexota bacterium]
MSLQDVRRVLGERSALIEYFFLGENLMAWSITRSEVTAHFTSVDAKSLDGDIRTFHNECQSGGAVSDRLGRRLADIFLKPFSEALRASSELIVVPYGSAHILPFQLLPWEGRPLVATHALRILPSASLLRFLPVSGATTAEGVLAVGNPSNMSYATELGSVPQKFPPLPAAGAEATFVSSLFSRSALLLDAKATDTNVRAKLSDYPILHFATHAYLAADAPLRSAVLLADGTALTVYDFMGMRIEGRLVVLSACETGVGNRTPGDEMLGLTRGLLAAGARAAVVSLWEVNSHSTSLLMEQFYRRLSAGDSPPVALQAAQNHVRVLTPKAARQALNKLRTLHGDARTAGRSGPLETLTSLLQGSTDYRQPFYWAPFVVVG